MSTAPSSPPRSRLVELAALFLRLGVTSFGGPAAHVALMEDEVVRRRGWMAREEFLDLLGATNLIPGPNSTEMAIHIGRLRAGTPGLVVAGACFILPAALLVAALASVYVRFGRLPEVRGVLYGVAPVIIGVVVQALVGLARTAVKTRFLAAVGAAAIVACLAGVHELVVLAAAGALAVAWRRARASGPPGGAAAHGLVGLPALAGVAKGAGVAGGAVAATAAPFGLAPLFLFFLKVGSVLFGSGYVLLAFLRADLVERLGWLSERQLLDAIAVGQVTPGPVFTTVTFIGYLLGGGAGAAVATLGIFLPAFVFVAASGWLVPRLRRSPDAAALLDGVNVASLALMAVVAFALGRAALVDVPTVVIALVSAVLLVRFRVSSLWLVLGGALAGAVVLQLR